MGRTRLPGNEMLPQNTYVQKGYYIWRNPETKAVIGLGKDEQEAIKQGIDLNKQFVITRDELRKARARDKKIPEVDLRGLLSYKEITNLAVKASPLSGVYFLLKQGVIVYIGKSCDMHHRVKQHKTDKEKDFDSFAMIECRKEVMEVMEAAYISKFKPAHNKDIPKCTDAFVKGIFEASFSVGGRKCSDRILKYLI